MDKILFLGAGSKSDPGFKGTYSTVEMKSRGIRVTEPLYIESCHGCPDLMTKYSSDIQKLVDDGNRVVEVLQGGLYFALPSIQATQTTCPIISVPMDMVAYLNFMLPTGNAVAATVGVERKLNLPHTGEFGLSQRQNAIRIAENILEFEGDTVTVMGNEKSEIEDRLAKLGVQTSKDSSVILNYDSKIYRSKLDDEVQIWSDSKNDSMDLRRLEKMEGELFETRNVLQVRGIGNLVNYAAKIVSLKNPEVRDKIIEMGAKKRQSYKERNLLEELGL